MNDFTRDETDILYNLVRDEHDKVMCGDWDAVKEEEDQTTASQELACMAGACEI